MFFLLKKHYLNNEDTTLRSGTIANTDVVLPEIAESRFPLLVFNKKKPVPREVGVLITSTSTNTVAMLYHRFEPFTEV